MTAEDWMRVAIAAIAIVGCAIVWRIRSAAARGRAERMESYLRQERAAGKDRGLRSANHLMATLGMTKSQVFAASKRSPFIRRLATTANFPGAIFADSVMFEYSPLSSSGRSL